MKVPNGISEKRMKFSLRPSKWTQHMAKHISCTGTFKTFPEHIIRCLQTVDWAIGKFWVGKGFPLYINGNLLDWVDHRARQTFYTTSPKYFDVYKYDNERSLNADDAPKLSLWNLFILMAVQHHCHRVTAKGETKLDEYQVMLSSVEIVLILCSNFLSTQWLSPLWIFFGYFLKFPNVPYYFKKISLWNSVIQ